MVSGESGASPISRKALKIRVICLVAPACLLWATASFAFAGGAVPPSDEDVIRSAHAVIDFLSSDSLEGRATGSPGEKTAAVYIRSMMKLWGIAPFEGEYLHEMVFRAYRSEGVELRSPSLTLKGTDDLLGVFCTGSPKPSIRGKVVFAGYGIDLPDARRSDYAGADVSGRVVLVLMNEPALLTNGLGGGAMTYYGRWQSKISTAAKLGARGILLVHTDRSAGYSWQVMRNSMDRERLTYAEFPGGKLEFFGFVREEALKRVFDNEKIDYKGMCALSESDGFSPVELPFEATLSSAKNAARDVKSCNVVGVIPGSDPSRRGEALVISAHHDHLGRAPDAPGDQVFSGAIDNCSATAALLLTARVLSERSPRLPCSVVVLSATAEEDGLLGSKRFAAGLDPRHTLADINFESTPVWGRSSDFFGIGAKFSTLKSPLLKVLAESGLNFTEDFMPDQGFFYRSDNFSFAMNGVPSVWLSAGDGYPDGKARLKGFFTGDYHTPRDRYDPAWEMGGLLQTVRVAARLLEVLAESPERPEILPAPPFPTRTRERSQHAVSEPK